MWISLDAGSCSRLTKPLFLAASLAFSVNRLCAGCWRRFRWKLCTLEWVEQFQDTCVQTTMLILKIKHMSFGLNTSFSLFEYFSWSVISIQQGSINASYRHYWTKLLQRLKQGREEESSRCFALSVSELPLALLLSQRLVSACRWCIADEWWWWYQSC